MLPGVAATFHHAEGDKCARCWMILPEVGKNAAHPDLCNRCAGAVDALEHDERTRFWSAGRGLRRWSLDQGSKLS